MSSRHRRAVSEASRSFSSMTEFVRKSASFVIIGKQHCFFDEERISAPVFVKPSTLIYSGGCSDILLVRPRILLVSTRSMRERV